MATYSYEQFLKNAGGSKSSPVRVLGNETASEVKKSFLPSFAVPSVKETVKAGKDIAVGAGKELLDSSIGTARILQGFGKKILDPSGTNKTVQDTGFKSLEGEEADQIDEQLKSKNTEEKVGKTIGFLGSMFYPVGKAEEVANVANKTKKIAGASLDNLGEKFSSIPDDLMEGGAKVKDKVVDMVMNLDDKTKTAPKRTPKEIFNGFVEKGKNAMLDDRNQTPLEFVGESVAEGLKKVKEIAQKIGEQKSSYIKLPTAFEGNYVNKFNEGLQSFLNNRSLIENDKGLVKEIVNQFKTLGNSPSKGMVDKFIDFAQERLYAGEKNLTLPVSNKTTAGLRNLISNLNNSLKNQLPEDYRKLNAKYGELSELMSELNTRLGVESGNAGSLIKRLFSPSDARTKELFDELGKLTGQDYFRDARLAKFVMDVLGDTRAGSILQQIPESKSGAVKAVFDYAKNKISDPIKSAQRFIDKQPK